MSADPFASPAYLRLLKSGDAGAFELLVRRHEDRLLAVARRLLRCEDEARDCLQEAFLSAFLSVHRFENRSCLGTWLHRIVVNRALMTLRSSRWRHEWALDPEELEPRLAVERETPLTWLERNETCVMVNEQVSSLPTPHRRVLVLRDLLEHDTAEAAALLGVSAGALKTRLHRARRALRACLTESSSLPLVSL
ncbi:MAG: sigma-70 family RNA polymerase sigma factor [Acidobacteriota bacterium]